MSSLDELYTDIILELYKNPMNKGRLDNADVMIRDVNPVCGDEIEMQIKFVDGMIDNIKFQGEGCAISQASASILTEMAKGKTINDALRLDIDEILREMNLKNLKNNPVRMKCAALSLGVLKAALIRYSSRLD